MGQTLSSRSGGQKLLCAVSEGDVSKARKVKTRMGLVQEEVKFVTAKRVVRYKESESQL